MSHTEEDTSPSSESKTKKKPAKRRRWPLRLAIGLVVLVVVAWFAPSIVALTPLRQQIVPLAVPKLAARVHIGSASLGWFSSIRLGNVTIHDQKGAPLAEAPVVIVDKSLFGLLLNSSQVGTIRLDRPHVHLSLREGGSNLEDAIAPLLETKSSSDSTIACRIEVAGGVVDLRDAAGNEGRLDEVTGSLDYNPAAKQTLEAKLSARTTSTATEPGVVTTAVTWQPSADPQVGALGSGSLELKADLVATSALSPALSRVAANVSLAGEVSCDARWEWGAGGNSQTFAFTSLDARNLSLAAPQFIGRDSLRCESLQVHGTATLEQGHWQATGLQLESDLGSVQVTAGARLEELTSANLLATLTRDDCLVKGRLDLARLASVLPETLKIREGTRITSGQVDFHLSSQAAQGKRRIVGKVEAKSLAAVNQGRQITWEQPLVLTLAAHDSAAGLVIENLDAQASFLRLSGQGSIAAGSLAASGNLDRLASELGQFVDLDEYQFAGQLQAGLQWKRGENNRLEATGDVLVENFQCRVPSGREWREERLTMALTASGLVDGTKLKRLDQGKLELRSGSDELDASLTRAVDEPSFKTAWPLKCRLVGSLATWLPRVQVFAPLEGWAVDGTIDLAAAASASPERVELEKANLQFTKLRAWGHGLFIDEPELVMETSGTWDQVKGELTSKVTTLAGTAVALRTDNVVLQTGAAGFALSGDVDYRGDMARLMSWTYDPRKPPSQHLFGLVTGKLKLNREADVTRADFSTNVDELILARRKPPAALAGVVAGANESPWETLWSEKKATLLGAGEYDHRRDGLVVTKFDVASRMLNLSTTGKITELMTARRVDVKGEMTYDLPGIAAFLRPYAGEDFQLAGRDTHKFNLRGPFPESLVAASAPEASVPAGRREIPAAPVSTPGVPAKSNTFPPDLTGEAGIGWTSAQVQGLAIGKGELAAKLNSGVVAFDTLDLPLAEGRLRLAPRISLNSNPMLLHIDEGRILEEVRISPQMCQAWLKYVAPLLADATRAEGRFTLDLAGAALPLTEPEAGQVRGSLTVHEVQVGPGPLGQQALWIAQQVKALVEKKPLGALVPERGGGGEFLKMPSQKVDFQLVDRRVYHENLLFQVRDVTIRTKGSVGLDQSLELVAEVPVLDRWVDGDRLLIGLKGQVLQIPIRGTLSQPKLDARALEEVSKHLVSGAAGRLLEGELNKSLQKLFGPKK